MKKLMELIAVSGLLSGLLLVVYYWPIIPDTVPVHFNAAGMPTRFGPKTELVKTLLISCVIYLSLSVLSNRTVLNIIKPLDTEYRLRRYKYASTLLLIYKPVFTWHITYICYTMIMVSLGKSNGLGVWMLPVFIILLVVPTVVVLTKL